MKTTLRLSPIKLAATLLALCAGLTARADYSTTVMSLKPAGYWRLNETAAVPAPDWATNSGTAGFSAYGAYLSGVVHPSTGALVAQPNDGAAGFSGNRVSIPYNAALNPNAPFSVECWVYKTAGAGYPLSPLSSISTTVNRQGWLIYDNGTSWTFRLGSSAGYVSQMTSAAGSAEEGKWFHLVCVYDGSQGILYVDGTNAASAPLTGPYEPNPDYETQIGTAANAAFTRNFSGSVDEVAIYTNVLSPAEILAHYNNGISSSPSTPYQQLVLAQNPVAYYRLNEPAYTAPDPSTLPVTVNAGQVGALANGTEFPGVVAGVAAAPFGGFEAANRACQFDGLNGYVGLGNPDGLNFDGKITMMAWIKPQAVSGLRNIVSHGYITSPNAEVQMRINSGQYDLGSWDSTDQTGGASYKMPAGDVGRWTFLAGTYDGTRWNLYWNGVLVSTNSAPLGALSMSADWAIGARGDGTERFFSGDIDEVAIFTNALTAAQIQQVITAANVPPVFAQQPVAPTGTIYEGNSLTFSGLAGGSAPLVYQWTKDGANLAGKTTGTLTLNSALASDSGNYALVVTNSFGAVTSSIVALTVIAGPPLILQQPQSVTAYVGSKAAFSVKVGGSVPYSYQWMFNATNVLNGATTNAYAINNVQLANAGTYSCIVTNPYGSSNTVAAALTVLPVPAGYASAVLADKPIAYWRLGESSGTVAGDFWGGHNGVYNGASLGQPGFSLVDPDTAASFPFSATKAYVGSIQNINFAGPGSSATFSLEFWANGFPSQQSGDGAFICKGTGGGGEQFCIDGYQGRYRFYGSGAGAAQGAVDVPGASPDGTWQHVVGVCNGPTGEWLLYVNGQQIASGTVPTTLITTAHEVTLAARQSASAAYDFGWNALLDEVAIYDKALSADQVLAHYNARYGNNTPPLVRSAPTPATNYAGLAVSLSIIAEGTEPLTYQWQKGTTDLPGETNPTLTITNLDLVTSPGTYRVVVTNGPGSTNLSTTVTVLPIPTSLNLSKDLVLHLDFDGGYADSSGRGNNATKKGNPTFVPGQIGTKAIAVNVDTSSSAYNYVSVTNSPDLAFGVNDTFSVSFWANYTSWANDDPIIGNAVGSTYQLGWVLCDYSGKIEASLASTGNSGTYIPGPPLANSPLCDDGAWHNIVMIVDRGIQQASVCIDGNLIAKWSISGLGTMYYNNAITIGNDPSGSYGATGGGSVDDVGIWRRALTPLDAAGIYLVGVNSHASFTSTAVTLAVRTVGNQLELSWPAGSLQSASEASGIYTDITPAPGSPYLVTPSLSRQFYRVRVN